MTDDELKATPKEKAGLLVGCLAIGLYCAFWIAVVYVVIHFIVKYW